MEEKLNDETADGSARYVMLQLATWIRGTICQGERLLTQFGRFSADKPDRAAAVIEEEFFVVAARKLVRWIGDAQELSLVPSSTFQQLQGLAPIIIEVRDMRVHADDYIVRKRGRKQSEFHYSPPDNAGEVTYSSDATAGIVLEGRI